MPSKSRAQQRLMFAAAAHPGGAGGVPQSVGRDFVAADHARGHKHLPKHVHATAERHIGKHRRK